MDTPKKLHKALTVVTFLYAFIIYILTMAPTTSFWDCGEFIATSITLGVPHPPGTPLYLLLGNYHKLKMSKLEQIESCGQNRVCERAKGMYVAPYKYKSSFSVDTYSDLKLVNRLIVKDPLTYKY